MIKQRGSIGTKEKNFSTQETNQTKISLNYALYIASIRHKKDQKYKMIKYFKPSSVRLV